MRRSDYQGELPHVLVVNRYHLNRSGSELKPSPRLIKPEITHSVSKISGLSRMLPTSSVVFHLDAQNVCHKAGTLCIVLLVWIAIETNTQDVWNKSYEATPKQETHIRKQTSHTIVTYSTIRHNDRSTHLYHTQHHVNECR